MPFIDTPDATGSVGPRYDAVVVVPAFNAGRTITKTLESIAASIRRRQAISGRLERFAISVVDDASADDTAGLIARFGLG
ncbi:MAG TPA: glycosyltransferase, partial [Vicinamibacterales bacterium]|nr:glycosyltransferase [Vicinamibacterales bacterium]